MAAGNRIVAMTDEQTVCDLCGRSDLRGTVIVADAENVEVGRYGTDCVSRIVGSKVTRKTATNIEEVRRSFFVQALRAARRHQAEGDWATANRIVSDAVRFGQVWRQDEHDAVADVRARSREIRAEQKRLAAV